jgi:hypothetical protein
MDTGRSNNSKLTVLMRPMHTYAELTCARRPTHANRGRDGGTPGVRGSLAISTLGCCGTSDRAPRRGPRVSKTTAQRVARVLAVVGIGRAATEVGGNWPANHAPREPGRQRTISSSSLAVPCLHFTAASARARDVPSRPSMPTRAHNTTKYKQGARPTSRQKQKHRQGA